MAITEQELAEIEARCNAATPGLWEMGMSTDGSGDAGILAEVHGKQRVIGQVYAEVDAWGKDSLRCVRDADFITHARTDLPALVAELRSWREAMAHLREIGGSLGWTPEGWEATWEAWRGDVLPGVLVGQDPLAAIEAAWAHWKEERDGQGK